MTTKEQAVKLLREVVAEPFFKAVHMNRNITDAKYALVYESFSGAEHITLIDDSSEVMESIIYRKTYGKDAVCLYGREDMPVLLHSVYDIRSNKAEQRVCFR